MAGMDWSGGGLFRIQESYKALGKLNKNRHADLGWWRWGKRRWLFNIASGVHFHWRCWGGHRVWLWWRISIQMTTAGRNYAPHTLRAPACHLGAHTILAIHMAAVVDGVVVSIFSKKGHLLRKNDVFGQVCTPRWLECSKFMPHCSSVRGRQVLKREGGYVHGKV